MSVIQKMPMLTPSFFILNLNGSANTVSRTMKGIAGKKIIHLTIFLMFFLFDKVNITKFLDTKKLLGRFIFPETNKMFWMSGKINYHLTSGLNLLRRLALGAL